LSPAARGMEIVLKIKTSGTRLMEA